MRRNLWLSSLSGLALLGLGQVVGCGTTDEGASSTSERMAAIAACGLDDGTVDSQVDLRACDPQNTKKTTICHIPPGNPSNAHTLCVGNAAVPAHLRNHGDYLGACAVETQCPPPPPPPSSGAAGAPGSDATPDAGVIIVP